MNLNCFETAELTDVGRKRKNNEDSCLRIPDKGVFCVADGMGGVVGGDLASEAIVTRLQKAFAKSSTEQIESFGTHVSLFRQAANAASKWIREFAEDKVIGQMGSTLVALIFDPINPRRAVGLHAGDSRLYRFRNGELQLLTADHSAAAALIEKGHDPAKIPEKYQNELVRAVGLAETVDLEKTPVDVSSGDVFLLCSDGLTRMLSEAAIAKALKRNNDMALSQVAQTLISGANEEGGKDNVTVILVKMGDLSEFPDAAPADDLDEPPTMGARDDLESETLTLTKSGISHAQDSAESISAHTPQTDEAATIKGDTPAGGSSGQISGDTPRTDDAAGPPTPPTEGPKTPPTQPPVGAVHKEDDQAKAVKDTSAKGMVVGVAIAVIAVAGAIFYYASGSRSSSKSGGEEWPKAESPLTRPEPALPSPAPMEPHPEAAASNSRSAPQPPVTPTGALTINSDPDRANVFLQGRKVGVTPYETNGVPIGEISYTLGTMTSTGMVTMLVPSGQKLSTNLVLAARTGTLAIRSDPPGAEVWLQDQNKGGTPASFECAAGQTTVKLKEAGLADQTATVTIVASQTNETNVTFPYGVVIIQSEPDGAAVRHNGEIAGYTPYTNNMVPPGEAHWQLATNGWQTTNLSIAVSDHQTNLVPVVLQKEKGVLQLTNNLPGITASVDGADIGLLPTNVSVEADLDHTITAEYKGRRQTNLAVRVHPGETNVLEFKFEAEPSRWTNDLLGLGMVFVKLPNTNVWAAASRVTLDQFAKVMGTATGDAKDIEEAGQHYLINLSSTTTTNFTAKLTAAVKGTEGGFPDEIKNYHFALPTPDQWEETFTNADKLGIEITNLTIVKEWCLDGTSWSMAGYVTEGEGTDSKIEPGHRPIQAQPGAPRRIALRLMLVP